MNTNERIHESLTSLEDLLVREFRLLQSIVDISREQRGILTKQDTTRLLPLVEENDALLDELGQLEETRKNLTYSIAQMMGLSSTYPSLREIIPYLKEDIAERFARLIDGITTLTSQAREINLGIQTLASNRIDWVDAAQSYLLSLVQPQTGYSRPGSIPSIDWTASIDIDHRA